MKPSLRTSAYLLGEFAVIAALLFVVRFILRGHLVPQVDEECNLGGVAVDLLAHGIRFPLPVYAPNEYENGFFYSGLLTATSFSLLGRSVLALKVPTHLIVSLGAAATLWLLRSCLDELRLTARSVRWTAIAALIIAMAFSSREVVLYSTCAVGIGSHPEGSAIDMVLLALFVRRRAGWSAVRLAAFWALTGFVLHVNRGTLVLAVVLALAELNLARSSPWALIAVLFGFLIGSVPEFVKMASANAAIGGAAGWTTLGSKLILHAKDFPSAFVSSVANLADGRPELLVTWALGVALALAMLLTVSRRSTTRRDASSPSALGMTTGFLLLHLAGLSVMAQSGLDYYALHMFPPLVILTALLAGWLCSVVSQSRGERRGMWAGATIVGLTLLVHRPDTLRPGFGPLSALWHNREGAACSWRFGEAFMRLQPSFVDYTLLGSTAISESEKRSQAAREQHAIELCRSLSETEQTLDCIGGVARDLQYGSGRIDREPPAGLNGIERRAYAFYYGVRRNGALTPCEDLLEPTLRTDCRTAVQLDCFVRLDISTRYASGQPLARPHCDIPEPPMDGYYAAIRSDLLSRRTGSAPEVPASFGENAMGACEAVVDACY